MTEHLLTIETDGDWYSWTISCINPSQCHGWIECDKTHEADGRDACAGPYDSDEDAPWSGTFDEFEFHGEEHTWRDGYGWTVAFKGCIVQGFDVNLPDELDPPRRSGAWIVDDDWDDDLCHLTLVREATSEETRDDR